MTWPLVSVTETASYLARAAGVLTEVERFEIVDLLAAN